MADKKASELTAATVLNDTDLLYLVQGSTPYKITIAKLRELLAAKDFIDFGISKKYYTFKDDFDYVSANATGQAWDVDVTGTGAAVSETTGDATHIGVLSLSTGTTATGRVYQALSPVAASQGLRYIFNATKPWVTEWMIQIPTLPDGTQTFSTRVGFRNGPSGTSYAMAMVVWDTSAVKWSLQTNDGTTPTVQYSTTTAITAATWYRLRLECTTTEVRMYVNGVLEITNTTTIPTVAMQLVADILKSLGATARTMLIDWATLKTEFVTDRF